MIEGIIIFLLVSGTEVPMYGPAPFVDKASCYQSAYAHMDALARNIAATNGEEVVGLKIICEPAGEMVDE